MLTRLIFANVGVFTVVVTLRCSLVRRVGRRMGQWRIRQRFVEADVLMCRPWSVITHMFVHVDIWHGHQHGLAVLDGPHVHGPIRRTAFAQHLHGGRTREFACGCFQLGSGVPTKHVCLRHGAATMAIMAATATANSNTNVRLFLLGAVPLKYLAIGWVLLDYFARNEANTGGNLAHLGGLLLATSCRQSQVGRDWVGWLSA